MQVTAGRRDDTAPSSNRGERLRAGTAEEPRILTERRRAAVERPVRLTAPDLIPQSPRAPRRVRARAFAFALACAVGCLGAHADGALRDPAAPRASVERLVAEGVPKEPLRYALAAFSCARSRGLFTDSKLTLIDYSRPSKQRRLWVLDTLQGEVLFRELVAHGRESGEDLAQHFSNEENSHQSSLGLFRTAEAYHGAHGYSLRLDGLEPGVNEHARKRAIVIHGADYVTPAFAERHGRLGRSWGCPAVDPRVHRELIDAIRGGTAVFAYYPDTAWLAESPYQNCETLTAAR